MIFYITNLNNPSIRIINLNYYLIENLFQNLLNNLFFYILVISNKIISLITQIINNDLKYTCFYKK